jgi:hypothetical protein
MARLALVALVAASLCGCDGDLVNLGTSAPLSGGGSAGAAGNGGAAGTPLREWLAPQLLFPQDDALIVSNGTLTELEDALVYSEEPIGDDQIASISRRTRSGQAWGSRQKLEVASDIASPALSPDGLELWFGQNVAGGLGDTDVWLSRREGDGWGEPEPFGEPLNSTRDDAPRPPALAGTLMALSSKRHGGSLYQIYLASRSSSDEPWQDVSQDLLTAINSPRFESSDGFLTDDGLSLYFSSTRDADRMGDLFVAQRSSLQAAFGAPRALADLNTEADERDPWLSPDRARLYYSSNQGGQYALYVSAHAP